MLSISTSRVHDAEHPHAGKRDARPPMVPPRFSLEASVDPTRLFSELQAGSASALQHLIDRFWPELVRYAAWDLDDVELAQDVVQEAFIHVWERRRSWTPTGSPRAYLYRIVRSLVIDERRRKGVRRAWASREQLAAPKTSPTPADILAGRRVRAAFDEAVAGLPDRRREVFDLVFVQGLSHQEAAEVLGISRQTVANQMSAALRRIRAAVNEVVD